MLDINLNPQFKKQYEEDPGFLVPLCIYTRYLITIVDDGKQRKRIAIEKVQPVPRGRRVAWSILQDWGSCDLSSNLNGPTKIHRSFKYFCFRYFCFRCF